MPITATLWIALATLAVIQLLTLKLTIRWVGGGTENAWDNAIAYLVSSGLLIYFPLRWMIAADSLLLTLLAPPALWLAQTVALAAIYEVSRARAALLGIVHALFASAVTFVVGFTTAVVTAYIMYGKIIQDPVAALKFLLRLIGIELPLDA